MEREKKKKRHLKQRILVRISIVLAISMVLCSAIGYIYFNEVVRKQKIADEQAKQRQVVNQIVFMTEDIQNFAKSVIVDEVLQEDLNREEFKNEIEKTRNTDNIIRRLAFYNSLRTYIASSFLEVSNGESYSSSVSTNSEDYMKRKFGTKEVQEYRNHIEWVYSNPYIGLETREISPVICCRAQAFSTEKFGEEVGTFYVEVYLDYFLLQIENYGTEYDNVYLLGNEGEILYRQSDDNNVLEYVNEDTKFQESGVYKVKDGYLICENIEQAGWKICTLVTWKYLWSQSNFVFKFFAMFFLLSLALMLLVTSKILDGVIEPILRLSNIMGETQYNTLKMEEIVYTGDEIQTLYECYQMMVSEIQKGVEERIAYERQKKEMAFDIMLSQINPHYLYNVLNTIVYLAAAEKNKNIVKITNSLIYTLQVTLNLGENHIETSVKDELELTRCYVDIQKYRYPNMFEVKIECDEQLYDNQIPKTSIQPLVENALLHGILPTEKSGTIEILITEEKKMLIICVRDNGKGIDDERLEKFEKKEDIIYEKNGRKHIGVSNLRDRIEYLYGEEYSMKIQKRKEGGTEVFLFLPILKLKEESR